MTHKLLAFFAVLLFITLSPESAWSADNIIVPNGAAGPTTGKAYLEDNSSNYWPASVVYTTDGSGNVIPIGSSSVTIGTVKQGAQDGSAQPWKTDLEQYLGAAFSATNAPVCRLTNGSSYVDPTQIRALSSGTDSITAVVSGVATASNQATQISNQTNGSQKTQVVDGSGNIQGPVQTLSGTNYMPVTVAASATAGSAVPARAIAIAGKDTNGNAQNIAVSTSGQMFANPGVVRTAFPSAMSAGTQTPLVAGPYGLVGYMSESTVLTMWGKMFTLGIPSQSVGGTSEKPFVLINNPSGSGVIIKIRQLIYGIPGSGFNTFNVYTSPSCTIPSGTLYTAQGNRQTNQSASAVNFYSLPTCATFGSFLISHRSNNGIPEVPIHYEFSQWIEPGYNVLITNTQSVGTAGSAFNMEYAEVAQ